MAKIEIDQNKCIGCGNCAAICPASFKLVNGKAKPIKKSVKNITCEKQAADSCPQNAIRITD